MRKIFVDCGSNTGQGLRHFAASYNMDSSWIIETYEPNPEIMEQLKANIADLNLKVDVFNAAVLDRNGETTFSIMKENSEGSSVECLMSEGRARDSTDPAYRKHDHIITVSCFDISDILRKYNETDYVVVKLDVEGSEFKIVRKMLQDNTIRLVKELYCEWHTPYIKNETEETERQLIQQVADTGVRIHRWW